MGRLYQLPSAGSSFAGLPLSRREPGGGGWPVRAAGVGRWGRQGSRMSPGRHPRGAPRPRLERRPPGNRSLPMQPAEIVRLTPGKRVFFLTKDPELIRRQLRGELDLRMAELTVDELLDDINTD